MDRRNRIGGSDAAAALGESPYRSPIDVWLEKTGRMEPGEGTTKTDWGNRLEQLILDRCEEETGVKLHRNRLPDGSQEIIGHPKYPWFAGAPDAWAEDRIADAKSTGFRVVDRWGEPGTDEVPPEVTIQVMLYMELRRVKLADVPLLVDGHDFRLYRVHYDAELAGILLEQLERFWVDHVLADVPPKPQTPEQRAALVKALHPRDRGPMLKSDPYVDGLVEAYARRRLTAAEDDALADAFATTIKEKIGDAAGIEGDWGKVTWLSTRNKEVTDWEAIARRLSDERPDVLQPLMARFTTTKPGHRRFLFTPKEK